MTATAAGARARLHYIDWLKVLMVAGIFYYHCAMPFAYANWMISNPQKSVVLSLIAGIGYQFGIPFLFLVAGADGWLSLGSRTRVQYVRERVERLLVPMVVGLILLSPIQGYFMDVSHGEYSGTVRLYVPAFFRTMDFYFNPTWLGSYGYHLWFLGFLFVYALAALPLATWLRSPASRSWVEAAVAAVRLPGGPFLFVVPVAAVQLLLRARFPRYQDWADLVYWAVFYAVGALLVSDPRLVAAVRAQGRRALAWTIGAGLVFVPLGVSGLIATWETHPAYTPGYLFYQALRSLHTWGWMLLLLNIGVRWLDFEPRWLPHANEAALPFYVLHHPVVVALAFSMLPWGVSLWIKHGLLVAGAFTVTLAVYEVAIRPYDPLRRLFGLKPRRQTRAWRLAHPAPA